MIKSISEKRSNLRYLLPFFEIFAVKSSTIISLGFRFYHFGAISRVDFFDHEFFIFLPVMSDDVIGHDRKLKKGLFSGKIKNSWSKKSTREIAPKW